MATRKRTRPALYELMKGQRIYSPSQQMPAERSTNHELDHEPSVPTVSWLDRLRAGHSMRIPIGYIFLGIPAVLLIVVVAYIFGFSRGETIPSDTDAATPDFAVNDPLARPLLNEPGNPTTGTPALRAGSGAQAPTTIPGPPAVDMSRLGPIDSDPRQKGITYYYVMETHSEGAQRVAKFCRENGLAAFTVASEHSRSRERVVVLPGFDWAARDTDAVKQLHQAIQDVGREYEGSEPGAKNFAGAYRQTYRP